MIGNFDLTVVKIEGLGELGKATCNIFLNDDLYESLLISEIDRQQNFVSVPCSGNLKIRIDENTVLASLQFSLDTVKTLGYHWLPLFTDEFDAIQEVPEEVGLPRVLVRFQLGRYLTPVLEITETSEVSENVEEIDESVKGLDLRVKIIELEQVLQIEKMHQIKEIEKLSKEYIETLKKMSEEVEKLKVYKERFFLVNQENDEKSKILAKLKQENEELFKELKESQQKYLDLFSVQSGNFKSSEKELRMIKEKTRKVLSITPVTNLSVLKEKKQKIKLITLQENPTQSKETDAIDILLNSSLKSLKLEGLFQKLPETYYRIGNKKVGILMKNSKIYCKFGENLKTLENFIYSHCTAELENFIKNRVVSKCAHKRSFSGCMQVLSFDICKSTAQKTSNKSITPNRSRDSSKPNLI